LQAITQAARARRPRARALITPIAALASLVLSWLIFYITGEILLEFTARMEQTWLLR